MECGIWNTGQNTQQGVGVTFLQYSTPVVFVSLRGGRNFGFSVADGHMPILPKAA